MKETEYAKCTRFLISNGWNFAFFDSEDERQDSAFYEKQNSIDISLNKIKNTVTFISEKYSEKDSIKIKETFELNFYLMIGYLFHNRQITCNYKIA